MRGSGSRDMQGQGARPCHRVPPAGGISAPDGAGAAGRRRSARNAPAEVDGEKGGAARMLSKGRGDAGPFSTAGKWRAFRRPSYSRSAGGCRRAACLLRPCTRLAP